MKLDQSVSAVVTGGASGLGEATARSLAARGVRVTLFDLNADRGLAVAREIGGAFVAVDVGDDASVTDGFVEARRQHGQERVLVNCAGIGPSHKTAGRDRATGAIKAHPISAFASVLNVNLVGAFRCIAASAAGMLELDPMEDGERGAIVSTASVAAQDGQIGQAAYSASKAGIVGMTLPIARDLMGEGIRVNTIMPGIFETPLLRGLPGPVVESLAATVPFPKRLGRAAEFAALALFMVETGYMNAEAVRIDGGIRMAPR